MFERYLTDALATHCGHVIENLDADKVRLSAWKGELVLEDLTLRPNALTEFVPDCPVEIAYGKIGNLELRIPWKLFASRKKTTTATKINDVHTIKTCAVVLTDVNILITPKKKQTSQQQASSPESTTTTTSTTTVEQDETNCNGDSTESHVSNNTNSTSESQRLEKEQQVQTLIDAQLFEQATQSSLASKNKWKWVQDWLADVFSTLSVTVRNIHIRYEDPGTCMGFVWHHEYEEHSNHIPRQYRPPFAVGITLNQFSIQTTNSQFEEIVQGTTNTSTTATADDKKARSDGEEKSENDSVNNDFVVRHKIAAAYRLAIYWDSQCQLMSSNVKRAVQEADRAHQFPYFEAAFGELNGAPSIESSDSVSYSHISQYRLGHTYILDPISPSVNLAIVAKSDTTTPTPTTSTVSDSSDATNDSNPTPPNVAMTPPTNITILLPPCKFSVSRNTLEDTAYIRKSLSIWGQSQKGLLSEASLRSLARLRPKRSAEEDPKSWWIYAGEATLALIRASRGSRDLGLYRKRRRGWIGLVDAVRRQRKYISLYKSLMKDSNDEKEHQQVHLALVKMEDELLIDEIVAFRMAAYESICQEDYPSEVQTPRSQGKSMWQGWMPGIGAGEESDDVVKKNNIVLLSLDHRRRMIAEMILVRQKEKNDKENLVQENERCASLSQIPDDQPGFIPAELNPLVCKASLLCREFAVQVNDQQSADFTQHRGDTSKVRKSTPVVRLSCAWVHEQLWYHDGSWDADCSVASLAVKDLTGVKSRKEDPTIRCYFPNLIGRKRRSLNPNESDIIRIDGQPHHLSMAVAITRRLHWRMPDGQLFERDVDRGSTTRTKVRFLPMEVVYSTVPVEALSRILRSVKTPELSDDYQRMTSVVHAWQQRQKTKIWRALAHKHKKIIIDVDVGAPEFLIPEDMSRRESPMLAFDLGRLQIFNDEADRKTSSPFDDQWRLVLSNIQVQSTSVSSFARSVKANMADEPSNQTQGNIIIAKQPLVEPFSLEFTIATKIVNENQSDPTEKTRVQVAATLPRLAFNVTSSALRLVLRLQHQWERRKVEMQVYSAPIQKPDFYSVGVANSNPSPRNRSNLRQPSPPNELQQSSTTNNSLNRLFEFRFSAPIVTLKLENDVDGRDCSITSRSCSSIDTSRGQSTPLVDLCFRGIRGKAVQEVAQNGTTTTRFQARLHSLGTIDLYQTAGKDFALLLSSVPPATVLEKLSVGDEFSWQTLLAGHKIDEMVDSTSSSDLVSVEYTTTSVKTGANTDATVNQDFADKFSVWFNELYVEWNPETLAAIQVAVQMPHDVASTELEAEDVVASLEPPVQDSFEQFFDAIEDEEFFDVGSEADSVHLISEVSSSVANLSDLESNSQNPQANGLSIWNPNGLNVSLSSGIPSPTKSATMSAAMKFSSSHIIETTIEEEVSPPYKPFEFMFKLSRLRVSFNKESRHRKVLIAQMDKTAVKYSTRQDGGSMTTLSLGNLVFTDPSNQHYSTLYAQILGLKLDDSSVASDHPSSLLEMVILINPRTKVFTSEIDEECENARTGSVVIDCDRGLAVGCNYFVRANFSPMRFVFLDQLWMEVMDYFFEGIIGTEVWGGSAKSTDEGSDVDIENNLSPVATSKYLPGADAEGFSFTLFDIAMEAPVVVFPVTYRSPEFIRLDVASISCSNRYNGRVVSDSDAAAHKGSSMERMQWFNNLAVSMEDFRIFSWCGRGLSNQAANVKISAVWPTGPLATRIVPKWNVNCNIDSLDISLRQSDYALLQNVISYNICEDSRHLDEWEAFRMLSPHEVAAYKEKIMVHFGYDNKDVAPSTYDFKVTIPSLSFSLLAGDKTVEKPLAIARCIDLKWQLLKLSDSVTRQRVTCDIIVNAPDGSHGFEKMLSSSKYDSDIVSESAGPEVRTEPVPELTYISISRPSGDSVKSLEIVDACIYMVLPAWNRFSAFFQDLPEPAMFSEDEVRDSIQVGDRWYRINTFSSVQHKKAAKEQNHRRFDWMPTVKSKRDHQELRRASPGTQSPSSPSFQLRVLLVSPRIILSSKSDIGATTRLILRMQHLDYLQTNDGETKQISRAMVFHDIEVYTASAKSATRSRTGGENSLIHPWTVMGFMEKCNGESIGDCLTHSARISADVLQARAAYSDMAIAIDVCLSVAHDSRVEHSGKSRNNLASSLSSSSSHDSNDKPENIEVACASEHSNSLHCQYPKENLLDVECDGFELLVVDDSERHFAGAQDLIILSLGKVLFSNIESRDEGAIGGSGLDTPHLPRTSSSMQLRLHSLDLYDCLQPYASPFRVAASSRSGAMCLQAVRNSMPMPENAHATSPTSQQSRTAWQDVTMTVHDWGFSPSPAMLLRIGRKNGDCHVQTRASHGKLPCSDEGDDVAFPELIELHSFKRGDDSSNYKIKLRSLALQWNPSTVIAIQRFLGRLRKESRIKASQVFDLEFDELISPTSNDSVDLVQGLRSDEREIVKDSKETGAQVPVRAVIEIDSVTLCLNKEHQHRRLLEATLVGCHVQMESSEIGFSVDGRLEDFKAWDSDNYEERFETGSEILNENRSFLRVASPGKPGALKEERLESSAHFLEVHYRTFQQEFKDRAEISQEVPAWVLSRLAEPCDIDDYLDVSVAALQFTYLRERTDEILDYLSNGLPGKGMGATSRAAKGFLSKRILTKSFLQIHIDSPQVVVPQHETRGVGMALKLGDVNINSWFEKASAKKEAFSGRLQEEWWRMLSLSLTGLSTGTYDQKQLAMIGFSAATKPIDLEIVLRKPTSPGRDLSLQGKLSFVDLTLPYTDYLLLRATVQDNVCRVIDVAKWDNVEKAYWMEEDGQDDFFDGGESVADESKCSTPMGSEGRVAYSSHARFVRYGSKARKRTLAKSRDSNRNNSSSLSSLPTERTTLDIRFELDGLAVKLRRNDPLDGVKDMSKMPPSFCYDIMLLRVQVVEVSVSANAAGDMSFHLSLFRLGLFDLGDGGRLLRERYYSSLPTKDTTCKKKKGLRLPCAFYVLAEGYEPSTKQLRSSGKLDEGKNHDESSSREPQLVVTVDKCPASSAGVLDSVADCELPDASKVTVARIVINYLSVNALIRPVREIIAFLSCSWPSTLTTSKVHIKDLSKADSETIPKSTDRVDHVDETQSEASASSGVQLKLVAHYPRVFFLADESDPHSRALVLRGLAVINARLINTVESNQDNGLGRCEQHVTAVDAQLHRMESYINPDVDAALRFKRRHAEMVGSIASHRLRPIPDDDIENDNDFSDDSLGIALIQPVTTGIEYCEIRRSLFPTKRSVFVNIEPVSTMLSFEDLELLEAVINRWSSERVNNEKPLLSEDDDSADLSRTLASGSDMHSSFDSSQDTYDVVFYSVLLGLGLKTEGDRIVVENVQNREQGVSIEIGDAVVAIDNEAIGHRPLTEVVKQLSASKRPTTVTFARCVSDQARKYKVLIPKLSDRSEVSTNDSVQDKNIHGLVESYTVWFRQGISHGLQLQKSSCGNLLVVTQIQSIYSTATTLEPIDESNPDQIEARNLEGQEVRIPRIGAVIVGVNDSSAETLDHEELLHVLKKCCGQVDTENKGSSIEEAEHTVDSYSISFLELDSSLWGIVDTFDISASGIALSFIDDLNGRDMPLFRGKLSGVEIHLERGLGIDACILDVPPLSAVQFVCDNSMPQTRGLGPTLEMLDDFASDSILTFSAVAVCAIDYYHPRIAVWEPLLEASQLFLLLEKQSGSLLRQRPGQLSVEVSDCLLRDQSFSQMVSNSRASGPQMVSLNFTDAAAEIFVKATSQWGEWRKSQADRGGTDEDDTLLDHAGQHIRSYSNESFTFVMPPETMDLCPSDHANFVSVVDDRGTRGQEAKNLATQKAAQAALVFAQKRGANTSKTGETAKPFVFRNRTGVSIAFVRQKQGGSVRRASVERHQQRRSFTGVGEYWGLEEYETSAVTELADQEEAKFDMEMQSEQMAATGEKNIDGSKQPANRVRTYEGRFPSLTVAIQAVSGVSVDPISDLQIFKVGSSIRNIAVRKAGKDSSENVNVRQYSVPVVWKVEIEDNRRILTLSSAVRVSSIGFSTSVEVGVQACLTGSSTTSEIRPIGVARPDSPFYVPLWLALKLETVRVYVRPKSIGKDAFRWGYPSVLELAPVTDTDNMSFDTECLSDGIGKWAWKKTFNELSSIRCEAVLDNANAIWFSCFDSAQKQHGNFQSFNRPKKGKASSVTPMALESSESISITLDSALTLRNMLPMEIEWEVASFSHESKPHILDGSLRRRQKGDDCNFVQQVPNNETFLSSSSALSRGECTEVFACDFKDRSLKARFRRLNDSVWSNWAGLSLRNSSYADDDGADDECDTELDLSKFPTANQVNVQLSDGTFEAPLTFGVRIAPKLTQALLDDSSISRVYGVEVIVYAELWIRNLTTLPLNFGCPVYQMYQSSYDSNGTKSIPDHSAARFTAESALMEIASVLEFGDKGTGFSNKSARDIAITGVLHNLPNQESSLLVEEVFEYLEIENSVVKRRWWASESYDSYRENITDSPDEDDMWSWIDESWLIDCAGQVSATTGGWESCRHLLGGAGYFSLQRNFDPSHTFRRRRWFRSRATDCNEEARVGSTSSRANGLNGHGTLLGGLQAFHQPLRDSFSREQRKLARKRKGKRGDEKLDTEKDRHVQEELMKISIKCGDGRWCEPATLPPTGTGHGVIRVSSSRWPTLTKFSSHSEDSDDDCSFTSTAVAKKRAAPPPKFKKACLDPNLMELCYTVSDVEGDWGELSRLMKVSPRFLVRNDSKVFSMEVKQTGAVDKSSLTLSPGECQPFYWADFRLPGLASVRPFVEDCHGRKVYRWSGGFDVCNLGMAPIRVRQYQYDFDRKSNGSFLRSIRALVEIRPGTGGTGINISFREEDPSGDGSLFRIENWSTFPIWMSQDGVLANPIASPSDLSSAHNNNSASPPSRNGWSDDHEEIDGDLVPPHGKIAYALDVPFRRGKYAGRKAATMPELLRVRMALAPLSSRAGIESVKVLGLTTVGDSVRLNPSKLVGTLSPDMRRRLERVRVLGVITTEGPTRVLKFSLMEYAKQENVFANPFGDVSYISSNPATPNNISLDFQGKNDFSKEIQSAAEVALTKKDSAKLPSEGDAKRFAFFGDANEKSTSQVNRDPAGTTASTIDQIYSIRAAFSGFVVSLVDSAPSEIAVVSLKNFNALARWNSMRTTDASAIMSVGWLQVDNHVPSAPFPVAMRPDDRSTLDEGGHRERSKKTERDGTGSSPLLVVGLAFAPKHKSGIVCLRSVTLAPRNVVIAIDLAFIVRLQRFVVGLLGHFQNRPHEMVGAVRNGLPVLHSEQKRPIVFPIFESEAKEIERAAAHGVGNQKLYFEGLTILPCNINLSVAPARALTPAQASLEGKETAAIHEAVRKGDVLVGSSAGLGVRVGRKNTTALAVVRGVFKSIVVDAILRLDGASLNFSGVFLRNHISTIPQLTTYLLAHYLASLRHNVPALLGSLAAFGNPLGLIRGLGDGVSDFVTEPVKGLKKSVKELDPSFLVDGVARGTESLARHTVGGFADSASLLTETFSKNMAVLTLDRRYAQKRDKVKSLRRNGDGSVTLAGGVESGFIKLVGGFMDGVTGVVKAPIRGAEKRGIEGFAKGVGKGLLGLLVKPMIGISDAATDVMIGVKSSVEGTVSHQDSRGIHRQQFRPRRPMYGRDKVLRTYNFEDAAAATLMLRTRNAGENYLSHVDMGDRVALLSVRRLLLLGPKGQELLVLKFKHVSTIEVRAVRQEDGSDGWGLIIVLNTPRRNGSEVEVICCKERSQAIELGSHIKRGLDLVAGDT